MNNRKIFFYAVLASGLLHLLALGLLEGKLNFKINYKAPETKLIDLDDKKAALLPEIKMIGNYKQFKASSKTKPKSSDSDNIYSTAENTIREKDIEAYKQSEQAMLRYQDNVKQKIEANRHYPQRAQRMKVQGISKVAFTINRDGASKNIRIVESSGSKLLDDQALSTIKKASPFNRFPEQIKKSSIDIYVAIVFSL